MFISQNAQAELTSINHFKYSVAFLAYSFPATHTYLILNAGKCAIPSDVHAEIINSHGVICLLIHS